MQISVLFCCLSTGFKLTAIWSQHTVGDSLEMEETENATVLDAEEWLLSPVLQINM